MLCQLNRSAVGIDKSDDDESKLVVGAISAMDVGNKNLIGIFNALGGVN